MAFTEFYCNASTGSNLNGGSSEGSPIEYTGGTWVQSTGIFTVASGNPVSDGVAVGDFASIYADGAGAPTGFVGRVTARDSTTITVSLTAMSGTAPADGSNNRTCRVKGAWEGPNNASGFPLSFVTNALSDASAKSPRINLKNNASYSISSGITMANAGDIAVAGYSSVVGDSGMAEISGSGNQIDCLTISAGNITIFNLIISNTATLGTNSGVVWSTTGNCAAVKIVATGHRNYGLNLNVYGITCVECEAYGNNTAGTAGRAGIRTGSSAALIRCISHDNSTGTTSGFLFTAGTTVMVSCIADTNTGDGVLNTGSSPLVMIACDYYNNSGDGLDLNASTAQVVHVENCNFIKNGGYGINGSGSGTRRGGINNCGFGTGTQANTSGTITGLKSIVESGSVTYAADMTPWIDPGDGDFRINLATAKASGRGAFTQTQSGYGDPNPTVAYPDIGAAQHQEVGGGGFPILGGTVVR